MTNSQQQLILNVSLKDSYSFTNFNPANNEAMLSQLCSDDSEGCWYLWGSSGLGKTHLLQAMCHRYQDLGLQSVYLSFSPLDLSPEELAFIKPEMFEGLENYPLICLDDVNEKFGDDAWEEAFFHLFNRVRDNNNLLVMSSNVAPLAAEIKLADLASRLNSSLTFQVKDISDTEKVNVLISRAAARGMSLSVESANYILTRQGRNMAELMTLLDKIDEQSLVNKRTLTIPFLKTLLD